jgi:hypothetical protein
MQIVKSSSDRTDHYVFLPFADSDCIILGKMEPSLMEVKAVKLVFPQDNPLLSTFLLLTFGCFHNH